MDLYRHKPLDHHIVPLVPPILHNQMATNWPGFGHSLLPWVCSHFVGSMECKCTGSLAVGTWDSRHHRVAAMEEWRNIGAGKTSEIVGDRGRDKRIGMGIEKEAKRKGHRDWNWRHRSSIHHHWSRGRRIHCQRRWVRQTLLDRHVHYRRGRVQIDQWQN